MEENNELNSLSFLSVRYLSIMVEKSLSTVRGREVTDARFMETDRLQRLSIQLKDGSTVMLEIVHEGTQSK